jgi:glycosyltransferase involved in cell wall biosynthesis
MRIGIAAPIEVASLSNHLPNLKEQDLSLGFGGTAINILIDGFIQLGHHVTVFTLDPNIIEKHVLEGPNLKIFFGNFRADSKLKWVDFCRKEFKQIQKFILDEKKNIDIVNAHWSYEYAIGTILANVPHLITFRDHAPTILKLTKHPYRFTRLLMDNWVRRNGKKFSYNSLYLKSLIGLAGSALPNPINSQEITGPRKFPKDKKVFKICYIANGWDYRKNPEAAIEAFYLLQQELPNVELHMIGNGFESRGEKYEIVIHNGKGRNVHFRGAMKHDLLMKELQTFDVLLHSAREESFGNNLIEAMAKGIPVVAGESAGAIPWVLNNGLAGCLTDIENPVQMAQDLKYLLTDPDFYEDLSLNGIINLQQRFVQEKVCDLYIQQFVKIAKGKN